jgi:hypothetical protein
MMFTCMINEWLNINRKVEGTIGGSYTKDYCKAHGKAWAHKPVLPLLEAMHRFQMEEDLKMAEAIEELS